MHAFILRSCIDACWRSQQLPNADQQSAVLQPLVVFLRPLQSRSLLLHLNLPISRTQPSMSSDAASHSSQPHEPQPTATFNFSHAEHLKHYARTVPMFVPGVDTVHRLCAQLLTETIGPDAHVLVLGAGGGLELRAFASLQPRWRFTGVDPSLPMLEQAKSMLSTDESRVTWVNGVITDAPAGPFDGASCLMTLHMLHDDGSKLTTLSELRSRLKPKAPLVLFDNCIDTDREESKRLIERYGQFALDHGADPAMVEKNKKGVLSMHTGITPQREEQLLSEAGYRAIELFYAALSWRAWIAYA